MPQKAHVTSLDALEAFRSNLIVYVSQARPALDDQHEAIDHAFPRERYGNRDESRVDRGTLVAPAA